MERDGDKEGFTIRCKVIIHSIADIEVFLADRTGYQVNDRIIYNAANADSGMCR